jgi:hypothetical protein
MEFDDKQKSILKTIEDLSNYKAECNADCPSCRIRYGTDLEPGRPVSTIYSKGPCTALKTAAENCLAVAPLYGEAWKYASKICSTPEGSASVVFDPKMNQQRFSEMQMLLVRDFASTNGGLDSYPLEIPEVQNEEVEDDLQGNSSDMDLVEPIRISTNVKKAHQILI